MTCDEMCDIAPGEELTVSGRWHNVAQAESCAIVPGRVVPAQRPRSRNAPEARVTRILAILEARNCGGGHRSEGSSPARGSQPGAQAGRHRPRRARDAKGCNC